MNGEVSGTVKKCANKFSSQWPIITARREDHEALSGYLQALQARPSGSAGRPRQSYKQHQLLDYGDLVGLAATLADEFPQVGTAERDKYAVVLLTSSKTLACPAATVFEAVRQRTPRHRGGRPEPVHLRVRGASAGQLPRFRYSFPS